MSSGLGAILSFYSRQRRAAGADPLIRTRLAYAGRGRLTQHSIDLNELVKTMSALLPVVLSSGYTALEDSESLPPGVRSLPKPCDVHRLEAMIREVLAARR